MLDAREYLHLAVRSSQEGDHEKALEQLHACLGREPENGMALFMLGAEYAELGLYDRSIENLKKAVVIDENIEMAHLQLGMILAGMGKVEEAISSWKALLGVVRLEYLKLMAEGLILVCQNERDKGVELVGEGMNLNKENSALNQSMKNIISALSGDADKSESSDEYGDSGEEKGKPWLGAYKNSTIGEG